jgi:hypothetical protein
VVIPFPFDGVARSRKKLVRPSLVKRIVTVVSPRISSLESLSSSAKT